MADPLSVISAVAGLVVLGTKLTVVISGYVDATRNAPAQVHALNVHLTTLMSVLQNLHRFLDESQNMLRVVPAHALDELRVVLDGCMSILMELQGMINKLLKSKGGQIAKLGRRIQWVLREKDLDNLLRSLEMYKLTINLTLNLATYSGTTDVNNRTYRMELEISEMHRLLRKFATKVEPSDTGSIRESIFGVDSDSESIANATYQSSVVLERYLSGLASVYSSSRPGSMMSNEDQEMEGQNRSTGNTRGIDGTIMQANDEELARTGRFQSAGGGSRFASSKNPDSTLPQSSRFLRSEKIESTKPSPNVQELEVVQAGIDLQAPNGISRLIPYVMVTWKALEPVDYLPRSSYIYDPADPNEHFDAENFTLVNFFAIGDGAAGKSSVFDRFLTGSLPESWQPCVLEELQTQRSLTKSIPQLPGVDTICIRLMDNTGLEGYEWIRAFSYPRADLVMLCYSLDNRDSFSNAQTVWMDELKHQYGHRGKIYKPFVLVGCRRDVRDENEQKTHDEYVSEEEGRELARTLGAHGYFECSSKTGEGIEELFQECAGMALGWRIHTRNRKADDGKKCVMM